jgi:pimeloyl-ACP methyl ester carboxylesterase
VQHTVPNARVLTYGYDTHIRHYFGPSVNKCTVYDIAKDFLVALEASRVHEPYMPILFVGHSLGGIVVKETLRQSKQASQKNLGTIFESTAGIMFFGTPHGGSDPRNFLCNVAEKFFKATGVQVNEQIVNALLPSSERLRELRDEFPSMAVERKWTIYSFQEQYGVPWLKGRKVR